jgi:hypothetical protein
MVYEYDIINNALYLDSVELPLHSQEENVIGTCSNCNSDVQSISYHVRNDNMVVAARCTNCDTVHVIMYDDLWNWLGDEIVSTRFISENNTTPSTVTKAIESHDSDDLLYLRSIPSNKLSAVFSPAEIEAMFFKASDQKYVRQYLYRARKKYNNFNELFDTILNI